MSDQSDELSAEEEREFIERFNNGEGIFHDNDEDVAYFEREDKRPVRVERYRDSNGNVISVEAGWVPFVGY